MNHFPMWVAQPLAGFLNSTFTLILFHMLGYLLFQYQEELGFASDLQDEITDLAEEDIELVRSMITQHVEYTNSKIGVEILEHWADYQSKFIKVFPTEYRKVLGQMLKDNAETERRAPQHG